MALKMSCCDKLAAQSTRSISSHWNQAVGAVGVVGELGAVARTGRSARSRGSRTGADYCVLTEEDRKLGWSTLVV